MPGPGIHVFALISRFQKLKLSSNMAEVILMPRLSDTMTEGVIAAWHKKVGDNVKKGDLLAEVTVGHPDQHLDHLGAVVLRVAEDIGYNRRQIFAEQRQFFGGKCARADVLQADGVDHAGAGFPEPWCGIAFDRFARQAFDDDGAELVEVELFFELDTVSERA